MKIITVYRICFFSFLLTVSNLNYGVTVESAYVNSSVIAEVSGLNTNCWLCNMQENSSIDVLYESLDSDFFSSMNTADAYTNPGTNSIRANASSWIVVRNDEIYGPGYTFESMGALSLSDRRSDLNASVFATAVFDQWFDFIVPLGYEVTAQTQLVQEVSRPEYLTEYSMVTKLLVVDTGELVYSSTIDAYLDSVFSLNEYQGRTLRFQTTGEMQAYMPQNAHSDVSGAYYSIHSRLLVQASPVPLPAASILFLSGIGCLLTRIKRVG